MLVGIDPDVDKNGVAAIDKDLTLLLNLSFFELFDFLNEYKITFVRIEAGWLNKSNWHVKDKTSSKASAAIGNSTGRNHETGRKIVEMLEYLNIPYEEVRPTTTKLNANLFKSITKIKKTTNQEVRDAYMLIHQYKIKKK